MPRAGLQAGPADPAGSGWVRKDLKLGSERGSNDFALGLASLPFVGEALRRRAKLLCVAGFVGMLVGIGFYMKAPPPYQAQATVLLAQPNTMSPADAIQTDVTLAQTQGVAGAAVHELGLHESVTAFLKTFTVDSVTDKLVQFTVGAPTSRQAVAWANALADAFLNFRADQLRIQQRLYNAMIAKQAVQAEESYTSLSNKVASIQAQPPSKSRTFALNYWIPRLKVADTKATALKDEVQNGPVTTQSLISGSKVVDPATPLPRSHFRVRALYALAGLISGIAVGTGYVLVTVLISDRLRRRDDVARALGTPVKVSVGPVKFSRWPGRGGIQTVRRPEVQKIAGSLRAALPPRRPGAAATLAVVAVGDPRIAALSVLSLAVSAARVGNQVLVADLSCGAVAARLVGVTDTGVRILATGGQQIALVVPERGDLTPVGPLHRTPEPVRVGNASHRDGRVYPGHDFPHRAVSGRGSRDRAFRSQSFASLGIVGPLASAYESTDLMLTVATLDPALGAEHLLSWADKTSVVVTAGEASATSVHAVGEMLRQAGLPASGAILVGADKSDLSVGIVPVHTANHRPPARRPSAQRPPQKRP